MAVENPFGHLPATQYGSLPFYSVTCLAYLVCLVIWGMWCISYSKEIMSVQVIIMVVLISFVLNNIVKVIYLAVFNITGNNVFLLVLLSILVDCTTRALTRILTLLVCMGSSCCLLSTVDWASAEPRWATPPASSRSSAWPTSRSPSGTRTAACTLRTTPMLMWFVCWSPRGSGGAAE